MLTNRPVKFVYSREEEMQVSSPRAAERIYIKDGVMNDGRIVARKVTLYVDAGAYSRHIALRHHQGAPRTCPAPTRSRTSASTPTASTPTARRPRRMRGFGVTIGDFALEVQMDRLARLIGMDPLEFRFINAYRDGDMKAHRKTAEGAALIEMMQAAAEARRLADLPERCLAMSSTSGRSLSMAMSARTRRRRGQLPDRHEPRRRPVARRWSMRRPTGNFVVTLSSRRSRPGAEDGHGADLRRDDRRADRQRHRRHRRHRHRPALHGHVRQPRHAPHRQRHHHGGAGGARRCMLEVAAEELEVDAGDLETDGKGNIQVKGAPAEVDLDLRRRRSPRISSTAGRSPAAACSSCRALLSGAGDRRDGARDLLGARLHGRRGRGRRRDRRGRRCCR